MIALTMIIVMFASLLFMKKFKYDFKGIELMLFWIPFTYITFGSEGAGTYILPVIYLGLYYLIRLIATRKYIRWYLIIGQIITSIIFLEAFSNYEDTICEGMCFGGLYILLLLLPVNCYMLIINFITLIIKVFSKGKNIDEKIDLKLQEENTKKESLLPTKNSLLYKLFIIFSILIIVFLLPFVSSMTSKFPSAYPENEASSGIITDYIANQIAIYVWPILITYITMLFILIIRKHSFRRVYYPLSFFTLTVLLFNLGIIYYGFMIFWYLIILFVPVIILLITLGYIGYKLDKNTMSNITGCLIFVAVLAIPLLLSMLSFITVPEKKPVEENNPNIEEELNNNNNIEKIKNEFNSSLNSSFISINGIKLSEDNLTILSIELLISNNNLPSNEMDFCNNLLKEYSKIKGLLNKYNYSSQRIPFKFIEKNPYAEESSTFYKKDGYIGDYGNWYSIYLNPQPIQIYK